MRLFKNIPMGVWMYWDLIHIRRYQKNIHKYRDSGDKDKERENIRLGESTWGKNLIQKVGANVSVEGREHIPDGPVVIVANHQSYADIAVLTYAIDNKAFGFVAKNDLAKLPLFGTWIKDVRSVFIEREDPRASLKAIEKGISYLNDGFSLGIFPEGTRSKGPVMGKFKKGSLRLATKPGIPILPVTIEGTYHCFEEKGRAFPGEVKVYIHPVIETKNMDKKEAGDLADKVEKLIQLKLLELQQGVSR